LYEVLKTLAADLLYASPRSFVYTRDPKQPLIRAGRELINTDQV
jgi:hypothetical protein